MYTDLAGDLAPGIRTP